ncbi:MAG: hypothetical protein OXI53_09005 [Nitrospira sp.]|nr:hypothetical protein [Nitrospira sp.]MDE0503468.1 hypothetical protein [Candidatus Poribacteria bacterium]
MSDVGLIAVAAAVALQKVLGPVSEEVGEEFRRIYKAGREKILASAYRKLENPDDGKQANLRVAQDVLWNGAFTDDEVCAEYFGGILASCRSKDGKDDSNIQFSSTIRSLSSSQLRLHYLIYNVFNKMLVAKQAKINVGQGTEVEVQSIWLSPAELMKTYHINLDTDLNGLYKQGLVHEYKFDTLASTSVHFSMANPTTFGVMLYAAAHNRMSEWRQFSSLDFGDFESIPTPRYFGTTLDELKKAYNEANT